MKRVKKFQRNLRIVDLEIRQEFIQKMRDFLQKIQRFLRNFFEIRAIEEAVFYKLRPINAER